MKGYQKMIEGKTEGEIVYDKKALLAEQNFLNTIFTKKIFENLADDKKSGVNM